VFHTIILKYVKILKKGTGLKIPPFPFSRQGGTGSPWGKACPALAGVGKGVFGIIKIITI
jgi:hypothetical protein